MHDSGSRFELQFCFICHYSYYSCSQPFIFISSIHICINAKKIKIKYFIQQNFMNNNFDHQQTNHQLSQIMQRPDKQQNSLNYIMQHLKNYTLYPRNQQIKYLFAETIDNNPSNVQIFLKKYQPYKVKLIEAHKKNFQIVKCGVNQYYVGEIFNGKSHGVGIIIFDDGRIYQGYLENNVRQGKGLYVQIDRTWYYGGFSNDKKDGKGLEILKNYTYYGNYVNGLKHGKGNLLSKNLIFSGEWRMGKIIGFGILQNQVSRYEGNFNNFLKQGHGYQLFKNGDSYLGYYYNGKPEGQGQYKWHQQKCIFKGTFKQGQRVGMGTWQNNNGDKYVGNYHQDLKSGYGQFSWVSGNYYKGNYVKDMRHGYGQMFWIDGSIYKGQWHQGKQNGKGELYLTNGEIIRGIYQNNVLIQRKDNIQFQQKSHRTKIKNLRTRKIEMVNINQSVKEFNKNNLTKKQIPATVRSHLNSQSPDYDHHIHNNKHCNICAQQSRLNITKRKIVNKSHQEIKQTTQRKEKINLSTSFNLRDTRIKYSMKANMKDNLQDLNLLRFKF